MSTPPYLPVNGECSWCAARAAGAYSSSRTGGHSAERALMWLQFLRRLTEAAGWRSRDEMRLKQGCVRGHGVMIFSMAAVRRLVAIGIEVRICSEGLTALSVARGHQGA